MIEIERVLNRSENAWESRVHRLRHDQLIGSINRFFDGLSAKLDIDPRGLKNKVDVVLDDEKYKELKVYFVLASAPNLMEAIWGPL